jgi:hypothetical protein
VAAACGQTAGNLWRIRRYRAILEDHIARQPGAVGLLGDETRSVAVLRTKLLEANLRAANLERDKKRLEAFAARHLSNTTATRPRGRRAASPPLSRGRTTAGLSNAPRPRWMRSSSMRRFSQ